MSNWSAPSSASPDRRPLQVVDKMGYRPEEEPLGTLGKGREDACKKAAWRRRARLSTLGPPS